MACSLNNRVNIIKQRKYKINKSVSVAKRKTYKIAL